MNGWSVMEILRDAWWWLCDRPLVLRLWLCDRLAGPLPETEADRIRRRSTMPIIPPRQRWWFFLAATLLLGKRSVESASR